MLCKIMNYNSNYCNRNFCYRVESWKVIVEIRYMREMLEEKLGQGAM